MLNALRDLIQGPLLNWIRDPQTPWQTLEVLYEEPRVERVWKQHGDQRLLLHRIHPCFQAFFHPHAWPSAVYVIDGSYRMNIGYGPAAGPPPVVAATMDLGPGSGYEMLNPQGWHDVQPYGGPSWSVMLTGGPWGQAPQVTEEQRRLNRPLDPEVKREILLQFDSKLVRRALAL